MEGIARKTNLSKNPKLWTNWTSWQIFRNVCWDVTTFYLFGLKKSSAQVRIRLRLLFSWAFTHLPKRLV